MFKKKLYYLKKRSNFFIYWYFNYRLKIDFGDIKK